MSDKRAERLRAAGTLAYGSTFAAKRYPEKPTRRRPNPTGPDRLTVQRVLERDEGWCAVCGGNVLNGERGFDWSVHHRRGRDRKADSNGPQNLILVHGASNVDLCHGRIHKSRTWAKPLGYWVSRTIGADPLLAPIYIARLGRTVWLTANFKYSDEAPEAAA